MRNRPASRAGRIVLESAERGRPREVHVDDLPVDQGLIWHRAERLNDRWTLGCEVLIVARAEMDAAAALDRFGAEPIELQLVEPFIVSFTPPAGWCILRWQGYLYGV